MNLKIVNLYQINIASKIIFLFSLIVIITLGIYYSGNPILDQHAFRQTQTALTSYYLKANGFSLAYETPVVGESYSIPFEFPIYQQIVAYLSYLRPDELTKIGRLTNLAFTVLSLFPLFFILKGFKVSVRATYFSLALFLSSPIYLFWGNSFMIEGAALFFLVNFIYFSLLTYQGDFSTKNLFLLSIFLMLGLLQKVTTILPYMFIIFIGIFLSIINRRENRIKNIILILLFFAIPNLIALAWIMHTDILKLANPIGALLTSSNLSTWNYGTWEQRISSPLWLDVVYQRNIKTSSFFFCGLLAIAFSIFYKKINAPITPIILSAIFFITPFLIFTNLHLIHNYYQFSNSIFFSVATGIAVCYILDKYFSKKLYVYIFILIAFLISNYYFFYKDYLPYKNINTSIENSTTLKIADFIEKNTPPDLPIIVFGYDWSSEVAFYSKRKSLTVPPWGNFEEEVINHPEKFLKLTPSCIVICRYGNYDKMRLLIESRFPSSQATTINNCLVYKIN
jgi:hypothetical protein